MHSKSYDLAARLILKDSGLCFAGRKKAALRNHLEQRIGELGLPDLACYCELLRDSAGERGQLYDLITVNETSFFRNPQQFQDLGSRIVPALEEQRGRLIMRSWGEADQSAPQEFRRIRVLCAGCSTGEEPYSVAMTLLDALRYPRAWDIEILAVDLSESCLQSGAEGRYPEAKLRGVPKAYRESYLREEAGGARVRDEVRGLVRFSRLNLARIIEGERFPGAAFDLIFCRNVMIYFPPASQQLLVDALQLALAPGGHLFTGDAEPLHLYRHDLETLKDAGSLVYRKKSLAGTPEQRAFPALGPQPPTGRAIEELLLMVSDASLGLRPAALRRLLCLGIAAVSPVLEAAVANDANANLRNGAMEMLVQFGEAAHPVLFGLLKNGNDEVRNFSTVMLGSIGSRAAVPDLIQALADPEPNVRHGAAEALGKLADSLAVEPLLALLDQGFWLQYPAIHALGAIGSARALPRLLELVGDDLLFEPVLRALVLIGDERAVAGLRLFTGDPDPRRARLAAEAIDALQQGPGAQLKRGAGW